MKRRFALAGLLTLLGCGAPRVPAEVTFLTREGCAATETMLANLKQAIGTIAPAPQLTIVDLDSLRKDDVRRGYPTPTLLVDNVDAFGLPRPRPPLPDPT